MPQQAGFYEDFSPKAFLKYMAEIKGVKKIKTTDENGNEVVKTVNQQIDESLEVVNLTKVAYKKIGGFSGGMKQRELCLRRHFLAILRFLYLMSRQQDLTLKREFQSETILQSCLRTR